MSSLNLYIQTGEQTNFSSSNSITTCVYWDDSLSPVKVLLFFISTRQNEISSCNESMSINFDFFNNSIFSFGEIFNFGFISIFVLEKSGLCELRNRPAYWDSEFNFCFFTSLNVFLCFPTLYIYIIFIIYNRLKKVSLYFIINS